MPRRASTPRATPAEVRAPQRFSKRPSLAFAVPIPPATSKGDRPDGHSRQPHDSWPHADHGCRGHDHSQRSPGVRVRRQLRAAARVHSLTVLASIRGLTDSVRTFRFWSGSFCCGRQLAAGLPSFSCGVLGLGLAAVVRMSRFVGVGVRSCCATVQASVGPRASGRVGAGLLGVVVGPVGPRC